MFEYDSANGKVAVTTKLWQPLKLSGLLARIFSKTKDNVELKSFSIFNNVLPKFDPVQFAYIYTDIIENQIVTDKKSPVLKVIPINSNVMIKF